jgi:hypothetical protein
MVGSAEQRSSVSIEAYLSVALTFKPRLTTVLTRPLTTYGFASWDEFFVREFQTGRAPR